MRLLYKKQSYDGKQNVYFAGFKIYSYKMKKGGYLICGENNKLIFKDNKPKKEVKVDIYGNNNRVVIDTYRPFVSEISIGTPDCPINNAVVEVGDNTYSTGVQIRLLEDGAKVLIGKDCLVAKNVIIWCTDGHSVFDKETNKLLNIGKSISIGDHVWVGLDCHIGKNVAIPNGCIVGMGSVVTRKFDEENSVIAGNPAAIVKRNIKWDEERPQNVIRQ